DRLPAAEIVRTLAAAASGVGPSSRERDAYRRGYELLSRYVEHTTDAGPGRRQDKVALAHRGRRTTDRLESQALRAAAGALAAGRGDVGVVLFNVAGWPRGGLVRMGDAGLPTGDFELIDAGTRSAVPYLREAGRIEFIAPAVPAGGYLYLEVKPVGRRHQPGSPADWNERQFTLHFESYSLQFHAAGGMCRWHDRARSMQWCSNEVEFPMGTYLYEVPASRRLREFARRVRGNCAEATAGFLSGPDRDEVTDFGPVGGGPATVVPEIGPLRSRVIVEAACPQREAPSGRSDDVHRYRSTFTVYRGCRDLHVRIALLSGQPATVGAGYGFFPLYGSEPWVLIDRIAHLVQGGHGFLRGVNTAHLAVHRGVRIECQHAGVNFYPLDTPMIGFSAPGAYRFDDAREYANGVLYATLFNGGRGTGLAPQQSGDLSYEFILRPTGNDDWDGGLARGGIEVFRPILGTVVRGRPAEASRSLLRVEPDLVHLVAMKPAESDEGLVLRLWSADPDPLTARLTLPFARRGDVLHVCDLLERPTGRRIAIDRQAAAEVSMKPHQIVTLLLKTTRTG
ncbi:MAG: hypothetical protein HY718_15830, partial [Planctomycetes bacterium]|nr:hypothetical protein [Planctomycetota bacterium]